MHFSTPPTFLLIVVWVGFLVCFGALMLAQYARSGFQKRMAQTVRPNDEALQEVMDERHEEEMGRSLIERSLGPTFTKLGRSSAKQIKAAQGTQLRDMLEQAGHPLGMGIAEFIGFKTFCLVVMVVICAVTSGYVVPLLIGVLPLPGILVFLMYIFTCAFIGYSGPTFWLRRIIMKRIKHIRRSMADVVDLIVLGIEAGLGFDSAVGKAVEKTKGPLTDELRRVLAEVNVGRSQGEAFRDMAQRVRMNDLTLLVAAIDQAMRMGVGLAQALRLQATEIREKRMAFVREQAGKLPVKMMLPLVLFIFPALFIIILGPAACQMHDMAARGELSAFGS